MPMLGRAPPPNHLGLDDFEDQKSGREKTQIRVFAICDRIN